MSGKAVPAGKKWDDFFVNLGCGIIALLVVFGIVSFFINRFFPPEQERSPGADNSQTGTGQTNNR